MKRLRWILAVTLLPIIIVATLWALSVTNVKNGFDRKYLLSDLLPVVEEYSFTENIKDILLIEEDRYYMESKLGTILIQAKNGTHYLKKFLSIDTTQKGSSTFYNSTQIYIFVDNKKGYYTGAINDTGLSFIKTDTLFTRALLLKSNSFVLRQFNAIGRDQKFVKFNGALVKASQQITPIKNDGGLATDGMFYYDTDHAQIIYMYYHTGEFIVMDTSLQNVKLGKTIDTFASFHYSSNEKRGFSFLVDKASFQNINMECCSAGNQLFIASSIIADNEHFHNEHQFIDIDVYNLKTLRYSYSCQIPVYNNEKLTAIKAHNRRLLASYTHHLVVFDLDNHPN